jgi:hypothetical protein
MDLYTKPVVKDGGRFVAIETLRKESRMNFYNDLPLPSCVRLVENAEIGKNDKCVGGYGCCEFNETHHHAKPLSNKDSIGLVLVCSCGRKACPLPQGYGCIARHLIMKTGRNFKADHPNLQMPFGWLYSVCPLAYTMYIGNNIAIS